MSVPWPEGSPQKPPTAQQMLAYLDQLGSWIDDRRRELDRLDQRIQAAGRDQGVQDMAMTLTVWQAIKDRYQDLLKRWDSGRVTETDLKSLAVMIWSNLNDMLTPGTSLNSGGGLALSLPEACRMLEALVAQLTSQYELAPVPSQISARIASLRAQLDRIQDQAQLDPPDIAAASRAYVAELADDVTKLVEKADRGGDIGGLLGPTEVRAARLERDLIVGHAERAMLAQKVAQARARRDALVAREAAVTALVKQTQAAVSPAPKYAVPHVEALGDVPTTGQPLDAYLARLDQVSAALNVVQQANQAATAALGELKARLEKAGAAHAQDTSPLSASLRAQIDTLLAQSPAPMAVITPLIAAYEASGTS